MKQFKDSELLFSSLVFAQQTKDNGDKRQYKTWSYYMLTKSYHQKVGESTEIINMGIQPHTKYNLYDTDTWTISKIM